MDARVILRRRIDEVLGIPMSFPHDYCATFAAGIIKDAFGIDVLGNRFGGEFAASEDDAYSENPMGLLVTVARRMRELGWRRVPAQDAPFGALAVSRSEEYGHGIAVANGEGWFVRRYDKGVRFEPPSCIVAAWHPPEV